MPISTGARQSYELRDPAAEVTQAETRCGVDAQDEVACFPLGGTVLRRAARATHANVEAVAIRCYVNLWAAIGQIERR
jgi:uncharacterized protein (UPF0303 family)